MSIKDVDKLYWHYSSVFNILLVFRIIQAYLISKYNFLSYTYFKEMLYNNEVYSY